MSTHTHTHVCVPLPKNLESFAYAKNNLNM